MLDKLDRIVQKYEELEAQMGDPSIASDPSRYGKIAKAHRDMQEIVERYRGYRKLQREHADATEMLAGANGDAEMRALAESEVAALDAKIEACEADLKRLLLPKDPNDEKNVVIEIRAGTGGDEAALFAADILRMYTRYIERRRWKLSILNTNDTGIGGIKEVICLAEGQRVYSRLKYESGVHRVQRVPATEASGRIHTSTVTVAVLPEAEDVDIHIDEKDIKVDTFCSSGPGGQSVNTTYSAVRMTHIPTGLVVSCQDEKSQIKNRARALQVLRSRLYERAMAEEQAKRSQNRKSQVGTGERSEKIRTYNFKENRLTDHRINFTVHQLQTILDGDLDELLDRCALYFQSEGLKGEAEGEGGAPAS
ncbi:MAG: peptide chain release factor 1 [Acidobacteriota bacterium]